MTRDEFALIRPDDIIKAKKMKWRVIYKYKGYLFCEMLGSPIPIVRSFPIISCTIDRKDYAK